MDDYAQSVPAKEYFWIMIKKKKSTVGELFSWVHSNPNCFHKLQKKKKKNLFQYTLYFHRHEEHMNSEVCGHV